MRIVSVTFESLSNSAPPAGICPLVHDLLWAHATPDTGLEHVRVRPVQTGLEAVCFVSVATDAAAITSVRRLLDRVRDPITAHGYSVIWPKSAGCHTDWGT